MCVEVIVCYIIVVFLRHGVEIRLLTNLLTRTTTTTVNIRTSI